MTDENKPLQSDAESRYGGTLFNLRPVTDDPIYPRNGDSWFRVDQALIKVHIDNVTYGLALVDNITNVLIPSQTPPYTIDHVFVVNSEAEMLAVSASVGDIAIRTDNNTVYILATLPPTVLANWQNLANVTAAVTSVNGKVGIVSLKTIDIPEDTNLYYTQTRFDTAFGLKSTTNLAEGTNLYYTQARFDTAFDTRLGLKTTDNLNEGVINLYWTGTRFNTAFGLKTTTNLTEGTNLYYTQARFDTAFGLKSTTNLAEGTNLYYTPARFNTAFGLKTTDNLAEGTANLYYTQARFDTAFGLKSTTNLAEGTNLYYTDSKVRETTLTGLSLATGTAITSSDSILTALGKLQNQITNSTSNEPDIYIVTSEVSMLALSAKKGDIAKRTDTKEIYILSAIPASTLSNWIKTSSDYDANVETVNTYSRVVSLSTTNISEGTNQYYTDTKVRNAVSATTPLQYSSLTGIFSILQSSSIQSGYLSSTDWSTFNSKEPAITSGTSLQYWRGDKTFQTLNTTAVPEGTNLYYTSTRFNSDFDTRFSSKTTDNLTEGTINLYYTTTRFDTRFGLKTTSDLTEGTNLYYTPARADARISLQKGVASGLATLDGTGKIPSSQLPAIAITDTFVVISQVAMLALTAQTGDVAIRTDISKSFILQGSDPTVLGNWQELLNPGDSAIQSVNGKTGSSVTLTTSDITEGTNLYYTTARANTDFDTRLATKSTTNLAEGTNLYYTDARVRLNRLDQMAVPTADISMNSHKITNVTDPTNPQDVATKAYVDYSDKASTMVSPATITANQNNYNPGTGKIFRLTSDANNRQITGLAITGVQDGQMAYLINVNSSNFTIQLLNQNAGSSVANRFQFSTNANINLQRFSTLSVMYDATSQVWRDV